MREEYPPSRRYLNILIRGAKQLGLDPNYVRRLESTPTYRPSSRILEIRQNRPKPQDLRPISVQELSHHTHDNDTWVSVLGYVIDVSEISKWFRLSRGRDITSRELMSFHDIPMDINDDRYISI